MNFFFAICTKVKEKEDSLIELSFDEIKDLADYKEVGRERFVNDLRSMNQKLNEIDGTFDIGDEIITFNLFVTFRILKTKDIVKIRVNPDFIEFFNEWANGFTLFELTEYVKLDSTYAKALYRLLKQWRHRGKTQEYSVDILKELLDAPPKYTPKQFKQWVIDKAVAEIKEKGYFKNLDVEVVKEKKRGAPVRGYVFSFTKEKRLTEKQLEALEHKQNGTYQKPAPQGEPKKNSFNGYKNQRYQNADDTDRMGDLISKKNLCGLTDEEQKELNQLISRN